MKFVGLRIEAPATAYSCPVCGKEYKSEDGLSKHVAKEHPAASSEKA